MRQVGHKSFCRPSRLPAKPSRRRFAFTLVEILIVVVILGILAMVVVPQFSNASVQARENTLKDELRYLRTQVVVFKAQHRDVPPGYPGCKVTATPTESDFIKQMTSISDELGTTFASSPSGSVKFGPYLSKMPSNPLNNLSSVTIVTNGQSMPKPDGKTGWIFKPQTGEIIANLTTSDTNGTRYADY